MYQIASSVPWKTQRALHEVVNPGKLSVSWRIPCSSTTYPLLQIHTLSGMSCTLISTFSGLNVLYIQLVNAFRENHFPARQRYNLPCRQRIEHFYLELKRRMKPSRFKFIDFLISEYFQTKINFTKALSWESAPWKWCRLFEPTILWNSTGRTYSTYRWSRLIFLPLCTRNLKIVEGTYCNPPNWLDCCLLAPEDRTNKTHSTRRISKRYDWTVRLRYISLQICKLYIKLLP